MTRGETSSKVEWHMKSNVNQKNPSCDLGELLHTISASPRYSAPMSCHMGAVNGWWELLHLPWARCSLSASSRVNNGNSVIHRKCGTFVMVKSPKASQVSTQLKKKTSFEWKGCCENETPLIRMTSSNPPWLWERSKISILSLPRAVDPPLSTKH